MPPEIDLHSLLSNMSPALQEGEFVFCCVQHAFAELDQLPLLGTFMEDEGLTLILPKVDAELAEYAFDGVFRRITLQVESSLHAVGLTAAVSGALAAQGIAANVVAACHHDHIFVPVVQADAALSVLQQLSGDRSKV